LARSRQCGEPITFLSGHIGRRSTCPMSEMGQNAKYPLRANVFRCAPALYARVATKTIQQVMSPLEHIARKVEKVEPPA
jgi:hypothetical protein